jgi:hypothetical protein
VPLGDNVQSITSRAASSRRRDAARVTRPSPFDNLVSLAITIEHRDDDQAARPHLAPAPTPFDSELDADDALEAARHQPVSSRLSRADDRATTNTLVIVSCALLAVITVLLVWGPQIERRFRPSLPRTEAAGLVAVGTTGPTVGGAGESSAEGSASSDASEAAAAPATQAEPQPEPAPQPEPQPPVVAAPPSAPVECTAAAVWPLVQPINDNVAPVNVASVTCLEQYASAVLVPAGGPQDPAEVDPAQLLVVTLRADAGRWVLLSAGPPDGCAGGGQAVDPAFPVALCL